MFTIMTGRAFLILVAACILLYYIVLTRYYEKYSSKLLLKGKGPLLHRVQANSSGEVHELVARAVEIEGEELEILLDSHPGDESNMEMLDDDDGILVKEAEKVIELIQEVVNHVASHPPNPEELFTKIRSIVGQYRIFENTEYFEAINRYIAVVMNRDCDIQWSEEDLLVLWK